MLIVFIIRYHLHLKKTMQTRGKWSELTMGELTIISLNLLPHCRTAAAHHREAGFTNATHHTHHTIWILRPLSSLECQHSLGYRDYHWNPYHCNTIGIHFICIPPHIPVWSIWRKVRQTPNKPPRDRCLARNWRQWHAMVLSLSAEVSSSSQSQVSSRALWRTIVCYLTL